MHAVGRPTNAFRRTHRAPIVFVPARGTLWPPSSTSKNVCGGPLYEVHIFWATRLFHARTANAHCTLHFPISRTPSALLPLTHHPAIHCMLLSLLLRPVLPLPLLVERARGSACAPPTCLHPSDPLLQTQGIRKTLSLTPSPHPQCLCTPSHIAGHCPAGSTPEAQIVRSGTPFAFRAHPRTPP